VVVATQHAILERVNLQRIQQALAFEQMTNHYTCSWHRTQQAMAAKFKKWRTKLAAASVSM
jgi:hypothetical protein